MNLNHTVKVVGSVLLSAVMAGSMVPVTVFAQSNDENPTEKTETVYSVLNSDGSISDTIVSSWLHDEDGINNIKETLNLKNVKNIKTNEKPSKDGNTYTWNAKGNDVYYEGDGTKQLPVSVKIRYELDGQEMSAKDIDGKSGHLKLTISFTNNQSETKTINGKSVIIHPSFLAGGMLNMSTGNFTNVKCDAGKIVNDGTNEILAFANIPGLNETLTSAGLEKVNDQLGISDDVVVEADVNDFDLGSIMIGMTNEINLSEELDSIGSVSELTDGIDQLMDADEQLIDGSKQLYDGTTQLKEQASPLTSASGQVRELSAGAIQLNDGVKSLQTGLTAYTSGVSALDAGVSQLYAIPQGVKKAQAGITDNNGDTNPTATLMGGIKAMKAGIAATKVKTDALDAKTLSELGASLKTSKETLTKMQGTINKSKTVLLGMNKTLSDSKTALEELQSNLATSLQTAVGNVNTKLGTANGTIEKYNNKVDSLKSEVSSLSTTVTALKEQVDQMSDDDTNKGAIQGQITSLNTQIDDLNKEITALSKAEGLTEQDLAQFSTIFTSAESSLNDMSITLDPIIKDGGTLDQLSAGLEGALTDIGTMEEALKNANDALPKGEDLGSLVAELKNGMTTLDAGLDGLAEGVTELNNGLCDLQTASSTGISSLKAGTSQLTANNATLNGGVSTLSDATGTLAGQNGTFNEMADGLDTLGTAFETLNDGAKQLYDGNVQFKSEGLDQLKEKVDLGVGEVEALQQILDEIESMNKEYASYSGAPEGATVTSRYVFRTKEESNK